MDKFELIKKEIEKIVKNSYVKYEESHIKCVLNWVLKLNPEADISLKIASLGHDIDRSFPERRAKREDFENYEEYKRKHAQISAQIIDELLEKHKFNDDIRKKVRYLIENHETGGEGDLGILTDADGIAFFIHDFKHYIKDPLYKNYSKEKIKYSYKRISQRAKEIVKKINFKDNEKLIKDSINELS